MVAPLTFTNRVATSGWLGRPEEFGDPFAFLCSAQAS